MLDSGFLFQRVRLRLFEIASVLLRFNHIARVIVNANHNIVQLPAKLR